MTGLRFVARMAGREIRAAWRRLLLLTLAVTAGVAALVALNSFTESLKAAVAEQSRGLLGADLAFTSRKPLTPGLDSLVDSLAQGGAVARQASFPAMAYVPRTAGTRLVQVAAWDPGFPFYGSYGTAPASAWAGLQHGPHVVVEPSLLVALDARLGDTLALGQARFVITGTVENIPGDVGIRSAFGARIFIARSQVARTGLLGLGSRAEYGAFLRLAPGTDAQAIATRLRPGLREQRVRVRTVEDDQQNLTRALTQLTDYLGLVALIALLLGGLGVASAVTVFIRRQLDSIAVLRCLGASSGRLVAVYLAQAALMGLAGAVLGAAIGVGVQQLLPGLLASLLPVEVGTAISPRAILLGLGIGLWVSLAFALLPLLAVRRVSPLAALRRDVEPARARRDPLVVPAALLLAASVVLLARIQVGEWMPALAFAAAVGVSLVVLWGASVLLTRGVRRWFPRRWPYVWRQGLANLYRPANQTVTVVLAVGFGAFLLATLFLVQHNLLRQLRVTGGAQRPNLVLFDIQRDQAAGVERLLADAGFPARAATPIVPMRLHSILGRPVQRPARRDTAGTEVPEADGGDRGWAYRREYRSTYRDTLVGSEKLLEGTWFTGRAAPGAPVEVSLEVGIAAELGVSLGDSLTWDVQGLLVPTVVTSLREVDWARFEPNFFVVFQPGALEEAPQSGVLLTRIDDPGERGRVQRLVAERFANVTAVDLATVQQQLENLLGQVVLAIRFMALFSLATGAIVLGGAIATSRFQRTREAALLRTLGASRAQVLRVAFAEYLALGTLAAIVGVGLSLLAAWLLARHVFEVPFAAPASLAGLGLAIAAGAVLVGLANSAGVTRKRPLEVLRAE